MGKVVVKVPTDIVRNDGIYLNNDEFLLYVRLCYLYFKNYSDEHIVLNHKKLMRACLINDNRTFKKRLSGLYKLNLIKNEICSLPTKGNLTIEFNGENYERINKHFTLMNSLVFTYVLTDRIDADAFRQLFYYKSHINLSDKNRDRSFCFVGYETIRERLKIGSMKIKYANEQLKDAKLIKIVKHKLKDADEYDENDELIIGRYNNHYIVDKCMF